MSNQVETITIRTVWIEGLNIKDRKYTIDGQVYSHDELVDHFDINPNSFVVFGNLVPEGSNCAIQFEQLP